MAKKISAFVLAALVAMSLVVTASAAGLTSKDYGSAEFDAFLDSGDGTEILKNAGNGEWDDGPNGGLLKTNRVNDYDGIDVRIYNTDGDEGEEIIFAPGDYILEVEFKSTKDAHFSIEGASPYGQIIGAEGVTSATLKAPFTVNADGKADVVLDGNAKTVNSLRVTERNVVDFEIVSMKIYQAGGGGTTPPAGGEGGGATSGNDTKDGPTTGIADVAVASAIALVAAGAVVFSRKKK